MKEYTYSKGLPVQRFAVCLLAAILVVVGIMTVNIRNLQKETGRVAGNYVMDTTQLIAGEVQLRMEMTAEQLETLSDSVVRIGRERIDEFLNRKKGPLNFKQLGIADLEGTVHFSDGTERDISGTEGFRMALAGIEGPHEYDAEEIIYTIPIREEKRIIGVMVGVRSKEYMQDLVKSDAFGGAGNSCMVDMSGHIVISSESTEIYKELETYLQQPENQEQKQQLENNMQNKRNGQILVEIGGEGYFLSCISIGTNGWILLSMIPSNIISLSISQLFLETFRAIILVLGLFAVVTIMMIQTWKKNQSRLEHMAFTDPVTGDGNGLRFRLDCGERLKKAEPDSFVLAAVNIKNFKVINETYGSALGDRVLAHVLRGFKACLGPEELAARGEADHFYLLLKEWEENRVRIRLEDMMEQVRTYREEDTVCSISMTAGVYPIREADQEMTIMQDRANLACKYREEGKADRIFFYDDSLMQQLQREKVLHDMLESAIEGEEFQVYLQPKVRIKDGRTGGAEALIRWERPGQGMIYPSEFIPAFERSGVICQLDLYVFERICVFLREWIDGGKEAFPVSVNLSRHHLRKEGFLKPFMEVQERYQVPASLIELELTESVFMDIGEMKEAIRQMHKAGFLCSMDDFGTGYSSLGLLTAFDIDVIKLDRSFFVNRNRRQKEVIEAVVSLAGRLGIETVAEGIEEEAQVEFLREIGCSLVQGYVYSKPLPIPEFVSWQEKRESSGKNA